MDYAYFDASGLMIEDSSHSRDKTHELENKVKHIKKQLVSSEELVKLKDRRIYELEYKLEYAKKQSTLQDVNEDLIKLQDKKIYELENELKIRDLRLKDKSEEKIPQIDSIDSFSLDELYEAQIKFQKILPVISARIEELTLCNICLERKVNCVLMNCGHQSFCDECIGKSEEKCPMCREKIVKVVKIYK